MVELLCVENFENYIQNTLLDFFSKLQKLIKKRCDQAENMPELASTLVTFYNELQP